MYSRMKTMKFTEICFNDQIQQIKEEIESADAILIGAGAGVSTSAGLYYSGERFEKYFSDFKEKYGITDMYTGGFYPFETLEEFWAWWSRHIYYNRYEASIGKPYTDLLEIVKDKEYFVLTTNVDHQFQRAGFDKNRLFYTQGDYGLWQCSKPCHKATYDNKQAVEEMIRQQKNMKIPTDLIPHCPRCGAPMTMNLRSDSTFVEDDGWHRAYRSYHQFLSKYKNKHILFLELGVGGNTPSIIKYPFWEMTFKNPQTKYICINKGEALCPSQIENQSICIDEDIGLVLENILKP